MYTLSSLVIVWMMSYCLLDYSTLTESERQKHFLSRRFTRLIFAVVLLGQIPLVINRNYKEHDAIFRYLAEYFGSKGLVGDVFVTLALVSASSLLGALFVLTRATMRHIAGQQTKVVRITLICASGILGLSLAFVR